MIKNLQSMVVAQLNLSGFVDVEVVGVSVQLDVVPGFSEVVVMSKDQNVYRGMYNGDTGSLSLFRKLERPSEGGR